MYLSMNFFSPFALNHRTSFFRVSGTWIVVKVTGKGRTIQGVLVSFLTVGQNITHTSRRDLLGSEFQRISPWLAGYKTGTLWQKNMSEQAA